MSEIDISKIPADVWRQAGVCTLRGGAKQQKAIALAILQERADCAQHAFRMRWAPSPDLIGTKNATLITEITTDWSQKIGMAILNRGEK